MQGPEAECTYTPKRPLFTLTADPGDGEIYPKANHQAHLGDFPRAEKPPCLGKLKGGSISQK
jgi:hypothetical protein